MTDREINEALNEERLEISRQLDMYTAEYKQEREVDLDEGVTKLAERNRLRAEALEIFQEWLLKRIKTGLNLRDC
jgi:hypothetical protein